MKGPLASVLIAVQFLLQGAAAQSGCSYFCGFENGNCDEFSTNWTIAQHRSYSTVTPTPAQGSHYLLSDTAGEHMVLELPVTCATGTLTFYYYLSVSEQYLYNLYATLPDGQVWYHHGDSTSDWTQLTFSFDATTAQSPLIISSMPVIPGDVVAIDAICVTLPCLPSTEATASTAPPASTTELPATSPVSTVSPRSTASETTTNTGAAGTTAETTSSQTTATVAATTTTAAQTTTTTTTTTAAPVGPITISCDFEEDMCDWEEMNNAWERILWASFVPVPEPAEGDWFLLNYELLVQVGIELELPCSAGSVDFSFYTVTSSSDALNRELLVFHNTDGSTLVVSDVTNVTDWQVMSILLNGSGDTTGTISFTSLVMESGLLAALDDITVTLDCSSGERIRMSLPKTKRGVDLGDTLIQ